MFGQTFNVLAPNTLAGQDHMISQALYGLRCPYVSPPLLHDCRVLSAIEIAEDVTPLDSRLDLPALDFSARISDVVLIALGS